ncbi:MAG: hypothetical protein M1831_007540 [Alyxoria varia]|nr:MAG: hypothetical protein M1831_007540 [Alyxoria varia]
MGEIVVFDIDKHRYLLPSFVNIHASTIETEKIALTFLPPLNLDKMRAYWEEQLAKTTSTPPANTIIMEFCPSTKTGKAELAGFVVLAKHMWTETGALRANVEKLIVSPDYRKRGCGGRLMRKLEEVARSEKRTYLITDVRKMSIVKVPRPRFGMSLEIGDYFLVMASPL